MVKIVNMETVVQLPMIVKLTKYSPEPHITESHLCLQSRLAATSLQEKAKELCLHVLLDCMVKIVNMETVEYVYQRVR